MSTSLLVDRHEAAELRPPHRTDSCMRGECPVIRDDGSIEIPLTKGQRALVDPVGYMRIYMRKWSAAYNKMTRSYYARAGRWSAGKVVGLHMHREVLGVEQMVDHRNHDTLDNRSSNLRLASDAQNQWNSKPKRGCSSRFKGVAWDKKYGRWQSYITGPGGRRFLGYFDEEVAAARAYDRAALAAFGDRAMTNRGAGLLGGDS